MITRFSSRRRRLDRHFLNERLHGALTYDRIAGCFSSSILEVAGEALEAMPGTVRMVCNSQVDARDVMIAKKGGAGGHAPRMVRFPAGSTGWRGGPAALSSVHEFLRTGKLKVRVLPDSQYGLIHGKAGVITAADGRQSAFLGSANESMTAWRLNSELLWEDDEPDAVAWVQEEFDALWDSPYAVDLAEFIVKDIDRLSRREVLDGVERWREQPDPAAPIVEAPVYRKEVGLWEHQKYFVKLAVDAHLGPHGARFVLADQVGLGKTLQLAMAAELMALAGSKPVLVLAPKPLIWQWQDEMLNLLDLPSAVWNGKQWSDEAGIEHPGAGAESIRRCPRRVGIVSTGLITRGSEIRGWLRNPLPPASEGPDYRTLRRSLNLADADAAAPSGSFDRLTAPDRARVKRLFPRFLEQSNPFIRHIVLRTRSYLENTLDPETGEPYLKPVRVRLHGENPNDAIQLPPFLEDAYHLAEEFCRLLGSRAPSGFFRTRLLRRVGSTMEAGRRTVENMLSWWEALDDDEDDDEETLGQLRTLTTAERALLERFLKALEASQERDPKYAIVRRQLLDAGWLDLGCIVFSQYFDSVWWLAQNCPPNSRMNRSASRRARRSPG